MPKTLKVKDRRVGDSALTVGSAQVLEDKHKQAEQERHQDKKDDVFRVANGQYEVLVDKKSSLWEKGRGIILSRVGFERGSGAQGCS